MRRSRLAAAVATALIALAPTAAAADEQAVPAPIQPSDNAGQLVEQQGCTDQYLIAIPGGANTAPGIPNAVPHGGNVFLTGIFTQLGTGGTVQPLWVSYSATPFAANNYYASSADGYNETVRTVKRLSASCPGATFSFTGYSLGADIASRLMRDIAHGNGPITPDRVDSAALFANPYQGGNGAVLSRITAPESRGALGELKGGYGELGERVLEICNPRDIVCSTDAQYRPLVEPALATDLRAGKLPLKKFNVLLSNLGIGALGVFTGMGAHGQYTLADQQEASNWIISHA
ncbi:cutinase family protein [Corynebacterium godavarianum]|uniref:Cutinase family protein n=1 Tax=Corynebacterium godavarianum TaxID=2054421 RepID=A0ABY3E5I4_9CORY|nr:cutinase family protein [Corynebacterium godavarianum]MBL7284852.1 cutinase family protein [Corynebacterium godavarianum]TSJ74936.1 cutinase family protein [Corynebacterium godavarianum]